MLNQEPSIENKNLAKFLVKALGKNSGVSIIECIHDTEPLSIDIIFSKDNPADNYTTYSTIGLSDYPMFKNEDLEEYPVKLEIVGVCKNDVNWFGNVIATLGFYIKSSGRVGKILEKKKAFHRQIIYPPKPKLFY